VYNTAHITLFRQISLDTQLAPVSQTNVYVLYELPNTMQKCLFLDTDYKSYMGIDIKLIKIHK